MFRGQHLGPRPIARALPGPDTAQRVGEIAEAQSLQTCHNGALALHPGQAILWHGRVRLLIDDQGDAPDAETRQPTSDGRVCKKGVEEKRERKSKRRGEEKKGRERGREKAVAPVLKRCNSGKGCCEMCDCPYGMTFFVDGEAQRSALRCAPPPDQMYIFSPLCCTCWGSGVRDQLMWQHDVVHASGGSKVHQGSIG